MRRPPLKTVDHVLKQMRVLYWEWRDGKISDGTLDTGSKHLTRMNNAIADSDLEKRIEALEAASE